MRPRAIFLVIFAAASCQFIHNTYVDSTRMNTCSTEFMFFTVGQFRVCLPPERQAFRLRRAWGAEILTSFDQILLSPYRPLLLAASPLPCRRWPLPATGPFWLLRGTRDALFLSQSLSARDCLLGQALRRSFSIFCGEAAEACPRCPSSGFTSTAPAALDHGARRAFLAEPAGDPLRARRRSDWSRRRAPARLEPFATAT